MPYLGPRKPRKGVVFRPAAICDNCGQRGPHFVPPSCGEKGFFICNVTVNNQPVKGVTNASQTV